MGVFSSYLMSLDLTLSCIPAQICAGDDVSV